MNVEVMKMVGCGRISFNIYVNMKYINSKK